MSESPVKSSPIAPLSPEQIKVLGTKDQKEVALEYPTETDK